MFDACIICALPQNSRFDGEIGSLLPLPSSRAILKRSTPQAKRSSQSCQKVGGLLRFAQSSSQVIQSVGHILIASCTVSSGYSVISTSSIKPVPLFLLKTVGQSSRHDSQSLHFPISMTGVFPIGSHFKSILVKPFWIPVLRSGRGHVSREGRKPATLCHSRENGNPGGKLNLCCYS